MASALHRALCRAVVITTSNNTLAFKEDGGGTTRTATIAAGTYYVNNTGSSDDLLKALADAMTAASGVSATYTVASYRLMTTGILFLGISTSSTSVAYIDSGTTLPIAQIGITSAQDGSFGATMRSTSTPYGVWSADVISSVQDPEEMTSTGVYEHERPDASFVAGRTAQPRRRWPLLWEYVDKSRSLQRHETSEVDWSWTQFWRAVNGGETLQLIEFVNPDSGAVTPTSVAYGCLALDARQREGVSRDSDVPTYRIESALIEDMTT